MLKCNFGHAMVTVLLMIEYWPYFIVLMNKDSLSLVYLKILLMCLSWTQN